MLTDAQKARSLKVHTISATDRATLESDLQAWLDGRTEEVVVGVEFEASAGGQRVVPVALDDVGASESDSLVGAFKPGFAFEIEDVQAFAFDVTAQASVDVKIGTTSALDSAIDLDDAGDATRVDGTLSGTAANLQGDGDDVVNVHVTTDGSGAVEGGVIYVTLRPTGTDYRAFILYTE